LALADGQVGFASALASLIGTSVVQDLGCEFEDMVFVTVVRSSVVEKAGCFWTKTNLKGQRAL
jgi:hypothetical protein